MRKLVLIIIVLLAILLTLPLIMGLWVKHSYLTVLHKMMSSDQMTYVVKEYHQGWFHSKAIVLIDVDNTRLKHNVQTSLLGKAPNKDQAEFVMEQIISHGPIVFDKPWHLGRGAISTRVYVPTKTSPLSVADAVTTISYDGTFDTTLSVKPMESSYFLPLHPKVVWHGITAEAQYNDWRGFLQSKVHVNTIDVTGLTFKYTIPSAMLKSKAKRDEHHLWFGAYHMAVPQITVLEKNQPYAVMNNMIIEANTTHEKNGIDFAFDLNVKHFIYREDDFGHGHVKLSIKGLDYDATKQLALLAQEGLSQQQLQSQFIMSLPTLITPHTSIHLEAEQTAGVYGRTTVKANVDWKTLDKKDRESPLMLLANTHYMIHVKLPVSLMKEAMKKLPKDIGGKEESHPASPLEQWLSAGWLIQEGDHYITTIEGLGLQVKINGKAP